MITITNSDIVSAIAIIIFTGHIWMYELDEFFKNCKEKIKEIKPSCPNGI